jgi:hypothetical protein
MLRSRPTVMGITTPGNSTVLRKGRMGSSGGVFSAFINSSSSAVINGINSVSFSFSITSEEKRGLSFINISLMQRVAKVSVSKIRCHFNEGSGTPGALGNLRAAAPGLRTCQAR